MISTSENNIKRHRACFVGLGMGLGDCRTRIYGLKDTKCFAAWPPDLLRCMPVFLYCSDHAWTATDSQNTHLKREKSFFSHRHPVHCQGQFLLQGKQHPPVRPLGFITTQQPNVQTRNILHDMGPRHQSFQSPDRPHLPTLEKLPFRFYS